MHQLLPAGDARLLETPSAKVAGVQGAQKVPSDLVLLNTVFKVLGLKGGRELLPDATSASGQGNQSKTECNSCFEVSPRSADAFTHPIGVYDGQGRSASY